MLKNTRYLVQIEETFGGHTWLFLVIFGTAWLLVQVENWSKFSGDQLSLHASIINSIPKVAIFMTFGNH